MHPDVHCSRMRNSQAMETAWMLFGCSLTRCKIDIYVYNGIIFSHKKKKILSFVTTWLSLQGYSAKQNRSDREKQASYDITYMLLFSHPVVSDSVSPWTAAHQASLSLTISRGLLKFKSTMPSHPLTPSSPSALNPFQRQGLFQWVGPLHQMTKILEPQLQHQSFPWVFRVDFP